MMESVSIDYNNNILTIKFNPNKHISFDVNSEDLNKSSILDYDGITIPPCEESYYIAMCYQIMTSGIFKEYNDEGISSL